MPIRITVPLKPAHERAVPPRHTGPAVYAAFLRAVKSLNPDLSAALHDTPKFKPFTLTPLLDERDQAPDTPGGQARFEVALLADELTGPVLGALTLCSEYRIGNTVYRPGEVTISAVASYPDLAMRARSVTNWTFRLITPVSFATAKDEGIRRERPWPDPVRVLTNLADRWATFAGPVALPESTWAVIADHAEVAGGELRIVDHLVEPSQHANRAGYRHGCVGTVSYRLADADAVPDAVRRAVDALAGFADYAGFGDRTAVGMGYVRAG